MNKRKTIAVGIVLALILIIGGTIAFFTDTDTKTNTFTIGDGVDIQITETFDETDAEDIHPGEVVEKAPAIENTGEVSAYVFAEVVIPCYAASGTGNVDTPLYTFTENNGWLLIGTSSVDTTAKTITYLYAYGTASQMTELEKDDTTVAIFDEVTLVPTLTKAQSDTASDTPNIVINAYAIQIENVGSTPAAVWSCIPH